ncbi:hypothetical protein KKJFFJLC_00019 [Vibrio phage vB_VpaS_PGB]|nr:hypothetical protein HHKILHMN_00015 [Vibrio phage vB_VpaS_PGA]WVH05562.1 hypothetical protein KKJFFJLC_00019 [Vibrio phage vB_VpaS_PGB]
MANTITVQKEMTKEQKELFDKLSPLQKKVAIHVIAGKSNIDAYYAGGGKAKTKKTAEASASELLSNPKVKEFINSMQEQAVNDAVMSRQEMLEELSILSRTKTSDIIKFGYRDVEVVDSETGNKRIESQSYWSMRPMEDIDPKHLGAIEEVTVGKDGLKFKKVSRLAAMRQLSELAGYNEAQKVEHTVISKADDEDW